MSEALPVVPFQKPLDSACPFLPGSKSLTNRALILACMRPGRTVLEGALFSRDTQLMVEGLRKVGFKIEEDYGKQLLVVEGGGGIASAEAVLDYGNAGTAARFLTAFLATRKDGRYELDGDPPMRKRPMLGLFQALESQNATFIWHGNAGHFPCRMETAGMRGGVIEIDARSSSQLLSALLLVAPLADEPVTLIQKGDTVSQPFIQMTLDLLQQFGVLVETPESGVFRFRAGKIPHLPGDRYKIEPDVTAASYFMALPLATGGSLQIQGLRKEMLQGDIAFSNVLEHTGVELEWKEDLLCCKMEAETVEPVKADFNAISDTFLTLAALSPLFNGPSAFTGIAHTRHQETDRVAAMATELTRLGQHVREEEDGLEIEPDLAELAARAQAARACGKLLTVKTYEDHRIAMSFAILACRDLLGDGRPWLAIEDPSCTGKTFPGFFEQLETLRNASGK